MKIAPDNVKEVITDVLASRSMSQWLKTALIESLNRDPVDATNDAELLSHILHAHCERVFRSHGDEPKPCQPGGCEVPCPTCEGEAE